MKPTPKKNAQRKTLKQELVGQRQRLGPRLAEMQKIIEELEAQEAGWHGVQSGLKKVKNAIYGLVYPEHSVPENYWDCATWLQFAPTRDDGYVLERVLKREALSIARPNGPHNDDGVVEFLKGDRTVTYFAMAILQIAYWRCEATPFGETGPQLPEQPNSAKPRRRKSAKVIDMQSFRDDKRARRRF